MKAQCVETLKQMLTDRNYSVRDTEFTEEVTKIDNKLLVIDYSDCKLGVNHIKQVEMYIEEHNIKNVIIVYKSTVTSFAKTYIENVNKTDVTFEMFEENALNFNITRHTLVPRHRLITSKEEKTNLLKSLKIRERIMPQISISDPISKYYGAKAGDLFLIRRNDENVLWTDYYRLVV